MLLLLLACTSSPEPGPAPAHSGQTGHSGTDPCDARYAPDEETPLGFSASEGGMGPFDALVTWSDGETAALAGELTPTGAMACDGRLTVDVLLTLSSDDGRFSLDTAGETVVSAPGTSSMVAPADDAALDPALLPAGAGDLHVILDVDGADATGELADDRTVVGSW
jgi:hypothetical protein